MTTMSMKHRLVLPDRCIICSGTGPASDAADDALCCRRKLPELKPHAMESIMTEKEIGREEKCRDTNTHTHTHTHTYTHS